MPRHVLAWGYEWWVHDRTTVGDVEGEETTIGTPVDGLRGDGHGARTVLWADDNDRSNTTKLWVI